MHRFFRVLIFADEANVMGTARTYNRRVDWAALRDYLASSSEGRELVEMVVYAGLPPTMPEWQSKRERKNKFLHWLRTNGFMVVTKDGSPMDEGYYKANVDVMMALDALEFAVEVKPDVVVLLTGDSDFVHLVTKLRRRGIRVEVASTHQACSSQLIAAANDFVDLQSLFNDFAPLHGDRADPIGGDEIFD